MVCGWIPNFSQTMSGEGLVRGVFLSGNFHDLRIFWFCYFHVLGRGFVFPIANCFFLLWIYLDLLTSSHLPSRATNLQN